MTEPQTLAMLELALQPGDWGGHQRLAIQLELVEPEPGAEVFYQARLRIDDGDWLDWHQVSVAIGAPPVTDQTPTEQVPGQLQAFQETER